MKYAVIATLLISMGAIAEDAAKIEEPAKAEVCPAKNWPTLNELWNETDTGEELKRALVDGTLTAEFLLGYEYSELKIINPIIISKTTVNDSSKSA